MKLHKNCVLQGYIPGGASRATHYQTKLSLDLLLWVQQSQKLEDELNP